MWTDQTPDEWTFEQRAALKRDLDQQLIELVERMVRLGRDLMADITIADYLLNRKRMYRLDEDDLPF
jgi:hypothetical protein